MAKDIAIDRGKRLHEEAHKGHNRWHPDISPVIEAEPVEEVAIETRDASDGQIRPWRARRRACEARPRRGASAYWARLREGKAPGGGFLPDLFPHHFVVHWDLTPEYATSPSLPGVRIPNGAFMGTAGVAPSREQVRAWTRARQS
jgi:formamidase